MMKHTISMALASILIFGCGQGTNKNKELSTTIHKRDSIQTQIDSLKGELRLLDNAIAEIDPEQKKYRREIFVSTQKITPSQFEHYFQAHGTVAAENNILITPEMPGTIKSIHVKEGEAVKSGQMLISLNTDIIDGSINEANTALDLAKDIYKRQEKLWAKEIGSEIQLLEAKNRKESLEQRLKTLSAQREKSIITAPSTGTIDEILPRIGEMVSPAMPVLRMVNLSSVYIKSDISENYLKSIQKEDPVQIEFPSLDINTEAKINQVGNFINPENRTFKIRVEIENNEKLYKPNLLAIISIRDFQQDSAIAVPSEYIMADANAKQYVFIVFEENKTTRAKKTYIETGPTHNGQTLIINGLKENDLLITEGARSVTDNEIVTIIE